MRKQTICLDFDGVINSYRSGFTTPQAIPDPPVPGVLEWISDALPKFKFVDD